MWSYALQPSTSVHAVHAACALAFVTTEASYEGIPASLLKPAHGKRPRGSYQGTGPSRLTKEPVGPSGPIVAIRTITSVPSVTVWVPRLAFRSVAVKPGSTELIRRPANALAYCIVSMFSAALDEK